MRPLVALFKTSTPDSPLEPHLLAVRKLFDQCITRWRGKDISPCKECIDLIQRYHIDPMPPPPRLRLTCRSNNPATAVHFTSVLSQPIWLCSSAQILFYWDTLLLPPPGKKHWGSVYTTRQRQRCDNASATKLREGNVFSHMWIENH